MNKLKIGVCYYPEHWDEFLWVKDLDMMQELGISQIRLAEFAWSKMQPGPDQYDFDWLDEVIRLAGERNIGVTLCTPTATPPNWLIRQHPEILPVAEDGRVREFGSRRHYSFNSQIYLEYSCQITEKMAQRYGKNPTVNSWQTDNELGCHDTTRSYGKLDEEAFQVFLENKYREIAKLNEDWGNIFWDQNYDGFKDIPLPNHQVCEFNPAHRLDYFRFASESLVAYNKAQVDILHKHCDNQPVTHNMMAFINDFDHYAMADDLDFACWDNYPLGFLEHMHKNDADKSEYYDIGHPDISAFYHDLYRTIGKGKLWIMEQQPGPVNWANYNPVPTLGAIKFWAWQAFAHGAELVCYFRWRQAPYAQEQMHAGLLTPDSQPAQAYLEVKELIKEMEAIPQLEIKPAAAALIYDYESIWFWEALPQNASFSFNEWAFAWYESLRSCGINLDIISPTADFSKYKLVIIPSMVNPNAAMLDRVKQASMTKFVWGPRSGSKTANFAFPEEMPPGKLQELVPVKVKQISSLRPSIKISGTGDFGDWSGELWLEYIASDLKPRAVVSTGEQGGIFYNHNNQYYLGVCLDKDSLKSLVQLLLQEAGIDYEILPQGQRICATEQGDFVFDFAKRSYKLPQTSNS